METVVHYRAHQQGPIRRSSKYPTVLDCLRELGQEHVASTKCPSDEEATSLNANDMLMLHNRLKIIEIIQERAVEVNKTTMESEKTRYELHSQIDQIEHQHARKLCHVFLSFFGVPRHYVRRSYICWYKT